jgi:hypothetical protein
MSATTLTWELCSLIQNILMNNTHTVHVFTFNNSFKTALIIKDSLRGMLGVITISSTYFTRFVSYVSDDLINIFHTFCFIWIQWSRMEEPPAKKAKTDALWVLCKGVAQPDGVRVGDSTNVAEFKEKIQLKFSKTLNSVDAAALMIYKSKAMFDGKDDPENEGIPEYQARHPFYSILSKIMYLHKFVVTSYLFV